MLEIYNKIYKIILTALLSVLMLYNYSIFFKSRNIPLDIIICGSLIILIIIYMILVHYRLSVSNLMLILVFIVLSILIRKYEIYELFLFCIAFLLINPYSILNIYKESIGITLFVSIILSIINNNIYNQQGDAFTFGFANQNTIAFLLSFIAILFLIKQNNNKIYFKANIINILFFSIAFLINHFLFQDRTIEIAMILVVMLVFSKKVYKYKLVKAFILTLPIILTYFTQYLAYEFSNNISWLNNFNDLLSDRIRIWNYYFTLMPLKVLSQNKIFVYSWGVNYTPHQGAFDGSYAYLLYIYGYLFTIIYIILLCLCNYKLLKYKQYRLLTIMIVLEIIGFSENQMFSYLCSFTSIFTMLSLDNRWLEKLNYIRGVSDETKE